MHVPVQLVLLDAQIVFFCVNESAQGFNGPVFTSGTFSHSHMCLQSP